MKRQCAIALASGLTFGAGLALSSMVDPQVVLAFLDVLGNWDPRLAFVMGGALAVFTPGYLLFVKPKSRPLLAEKFYMPTKKEFDKPLVVGAVVFGVGWGLIGLCPGPVIANLLQGEVKLYAFAAAMLLGMLMANRVAKSD